MEIGLKTSKEKSKFSRRTLLTFCYFDAIKDENINEDGLMRREEVTQLYKRYMCEHIKNTVTEFSNETKLSEEDAEFIQSFKANFLKLTQSYLEQKINPTDFSMQAKTYIKEAHDHLDKYSGWQVFLYKLACVAASIITCGLFNLFVYSYTSGERFFPSTNAAEGTYEKELEYLLDEVSILESGSYNLNVQM